MEDRLYSGIIIELQWVALPLSRLPPTRDLVFRIKQRLLRYIGMGTGVCYLQGRKQRLSYTLSLQRWSCLRMKMFMNGTFKEQMEINIKLERSTLTSEEK